MEGIFNKIDLNKQNPELIRFLDKYMTHVVNDETFRWEYYFQPEKTVFVTLSQDDEIIGTQSFLPFPLIMNGSKTVSGKSENSFIREEFRKELNFHNLYYYGVDECGLKSIQPLWGLTHLANFWKKILKFEVHGKIMYSFIFRRSFPALSELYRGGGYLSPLRFLYNILKVIILSIKTFRLRSRISYRKKLNEFQVLDRITDDQIFNTYYGEIRKKHPGLVYIEITNEFLEWRVYTNPNLKYSSFFFMKNGSLQGYYIFSVKGKTAQLVDFIALDNNTYETMTMHFLIKLKKMKIRSAEYFGNIKNEINSEVINLFRKIIGGKLLLNKGMAFVMKDTSGDLKMPGIQEWYINGLWTEGYKR